MSNFDAREYRRILGHYPTGVCAVTAMRAEGPIGMIVGSFTSVSLEPALVAFLPDRKSSTWPKIAATGHFCVNILAEPQQMICKALTSKAENRFADISHRRSGLGAPIIEGVVAWIDCRLDAVHEAGDHFIVIGRVNEMAIEREDAPLVFLKGEYGTVARRTPDVWEARCAA